MRMLYHLYWSLWHLALSYIIPASHTGHLRCSLRGSNLLGDVVNGDILIGAVLPFHLDKEYPIIPFTEYPPQGECKIFSFEVFQQFQAMRFAVEEINGTPDLLPNVTLGLQVYDSCAGLQQEVDGTLKLITGRNEGVPNFVCREKPPMVAIIGHSISTFSILMAYMLGLYKFPQISHFSTSSFLSDRMQFASFFRTVPSDAFQSKGLAQLVLHFGWTWVGLVAVSEDYGQQGIQVIKQELLGGGACIAFTEYIMTSLPDKNAFHLTRVIRHSTARVIVVFSTDAEMIPLLDEMMRQNVTGKILVASEAWSTSNVLSVAKYSSILCGSIGFSFHSAIIPKFRSYLSSLQPFNAPGRSWAKILWEKAFGCKLPDRKNSTSSLDNSTMLCTGNEDLNRISNSYNDVSSLRGAYNIHTAIYAIARSLHNLYACQEESGPFRNRSCADLRHFKPWQLSHYIQNVRFRLNDGGDFFFDENGDPPAIYDIVNWQMKVDGTIGHIKVGSYDMTKTDGRSFTLNPGAVQWAFGDNQVPISICSQSCPPGFRRVVRKGEPVCCFQCVQCPQGEISNQTDSLACFKCPWDQWPNLQRDQCFQKSIEFLSHEEPLGAALTVTSVFSSTVPIYIFGLFLHNKNTPVVKANNYTVSCLLLVSLCFCFLSSLTFIGYPVPEKCLLRQAAFGTVFTFCVSCILAKTIMVVFAFMATKPGSGLRKWTRPLVSYVIIASASLLQLILCTSWVLCAPPFPENNILTQPGLIIVECNENSPVAFWCMLGYLGLLATISFVVAFLARKLPDSFNEAKFITFSMLAFLSVWLSYIPASLSARGKYTVAMEIFAIQSSSWALVICMFGPKCFIILFRPNMNSREHLMGKSKR